MAVKHNSEIKFNVGLDENKVPETIFWTAEDGGIENSESKVQTTKAEGTKCEVCWKINQEACSRHSE